MNEIHNTNLPSEQVDEVNTYTMVGLKKSGYLEVKQPSNIKGRKLKTWKKKWVVVHKMTDLATGTFAAKFFLFNDEEQNNQTTSEKQAFIFDHVTAVEYAKSKTRPLAFQIVQEAPALMLSGLNEQETDDWMLSLKELFWPEENKPSGDSFRVKIEQNEDAKIWSLSGDYWLTVSPEIICIKSFEDSSIQEWNLNIIKRFFMDKIDVNILIIETGSISEFGEANFRFRTNSVPEILNVIKKNIQAAIQLKHHKTRSSDSFSIVQSQSSSLTNDQSFQTLLNRGNETQDNSIISTSPIEVFRQRSDSDTSSDSKDEYNSLDTSKTRVNHTQFVSSVIVSKNDGQNVEVKTDQHGYSHVGLDGNEDKVRSASGYGVDEDECNRSTSVCSCDSGIVATDTNQDLSNRKHKNNNSFDSGVSNLSGRTDISASIGGIFIMTGDDSEKFDSSECSFVPYSKVIKDKADIAPMPELSSVRPKVSNNGDYSSIYWDPETEHKDDLTANKKKENLYEDLDKYRKDLSKHLGFDPKINPTEVPPSLPDRPSTLPTRRKTLSKRTKKKDKKNTIQEMFKTVTRGRTGSMSSTSSTTSEGDDDKSNTMTLNRKQWLLSKSAVSGQNELYTSVPDEGIFSSGRVRSHSYEDKPNKTVMNDSVISMSVWPMEAKSNALNNAILYDTVNSQDFLNNRTEDSTERLRRSLKRSNSSGDLKAQDSKNVLDLLTGDDVSVTKQSEILKPISVSPEERDFIDFSSEISASYSMNNSGTNLDENSDSVWNPFPKIADFTTSIKPDEEESMEDKPEENDKDPFDIFHIGVVSSRLGFSSDEPSVNCDSISELSDLDKTIYDPNEEIYVDMGNQTIRPEQTVEYVLPTDVSRH